MERLMLYFVEWYFRVLPYALGIMAILAIVSWAIGRFFYTEEDWHQEKESIRRLE